MDATVDTPTENWPDAIYRVLKDADVRQACYVPDAGHTRLINRLIADPDVETNVLTTEEEGIPIAAGAWLGGQRTVLLMQSSGVGNTINMLSLMATCRFPFLTIVTMRGEWAEFNPWQVPMGQATRASLLAQDIVVYDVTEPESVKDTVEAAAKLAAEHGVEVSPEALWRHRGTLVSGGLPTWRG